MMRFRISSRRKDTTKGWQGFLLMVILSPFILLFLVASVVAYVPLRILEDRARRRLLSELRNRWLFVYSGRRGWRELIVNNVLPSLDDTILVICTQSPTSPLERKLLKLLHDELLWGPSGSRAPAMVKIEPRLTDCVTISLREDLRPLKSSGRRSAEVQAQALQVLKGRAGKSLT